MATTFSEGVSSAPVSPFQIATALLCLILLMCEGVDIQLLGLVAPLVVEDFGVDKGSFGIAMSAALVGMGIGAWFGGYLGDRIGRRLSLAFAALVFGLATIAASTAGGVWSMALWRLLGGLGFGSAFSNALAMTGEWLPARWRAVAITALSVGTPAGGAVAGALVPHLLASHTWRGMFVLFGLATLALVVVLLFVLRDSPAFLMARGRRMEAEALARRVLRQEVVLLPEDGSAGQSGSALGEGLATGKGVLHASNLRLNIGVGVGFAAATLVAYGILNWSTTVLAGKGVALAAASYAVSIAGIAAIVGSLTAGALIRLFGSRVVLFGAGLALTGTVVLLALVLEPLRPYTGELPLGTILALIATAALLFSAAIAAIYVIITVGYPQSCRSAGIGFGICMGRVGAILASAFGGTLLELDGSSLVPFFIALGGGAVLIPIAAAIIDRHVAPAGRLATAA